MELLDLHKTLEDMPSLKARATEEALKFELELELKKNEYNKLYAIKYLARLESYSHAAIKSLLDGDDELLVLKTVILEKTYQSKAKETLATEYDDKFTGAKVIARLKMAELHGGLEDVKEYR